MISAEPPLRLESWARSTAAAYQALTPGDRRIRVEDAQAGNPRRHRLAPWVDYRGAILLLAGNRWTIVAERSELGPAGEPTVYQVAANTQRGAIALGPLRAPAQAEARR